MLLYMKILQKIRKEWPFLGRNIQTCNNKTFCSGRLSSDVGVGIQVCQQERNRKGYNEWWVV